ncbi:MAG: hypothetical protein KKD44_28290 [Proteobacteria bacterium]|nr:hypothetical protein [Pseudomonadota bacterium]
MNSQRGQVSTIAIVLLLVGLVAGAVGGYLAASNSLQPKIDDFESQVADLNSEVSRLSETISSIADEITDYESQIADLEAEKSIHESEIISLRAEMASYESQVINLKENLENLNVTYQELILTYSSEFVTSDLEIDPEEVEINHPVTISITLKNIGGLEGNYNLQLKVDGIIESSKEITLVGGEAVTISFDVVKDEAGTYNFTLDNLSGTFNVIRPIWCEIGVPYVASDGLTVTLTSLTITEKVGSYQYKIWYTLKNEQLDKSIDEGTFKMYYESESGGLPQYGFFGELFPGDSLSRAYAFEELKGKPFGILAYHPTQFFSSEPLEDSLKWKVELP